MPNMLLMSGILFCCNTDSLSAEMPKALAIAVVTTVVTTLVKAVAMETLKNGKMIINIMKRKADDEADDEADGLQNKNEKLTELETKLSLCKRDILAQTTTKKLVTPECEDWFSEVEKRKGKVRKLQNKYKSMGCDELRNKKRRRQHGSSDSRTSLSKSMAKECSKLGYQLEKGSNINILVGKLPDLVMKMPGPTLADEPFLLPFVEDILRRLRDENVKRIGLLGEPKTGKTRIMERLNNNEDAAKMFDIIIWVPASNDLDFGKLQHIIARRLKLKVKGITDSNEIYHKICERLKGKRYLLLLDEPSGSFDPSWIECYGNEKDSKVVLTTRFHPVCCRMNTAVIPVARMTNAVAWELFQKKVGPNMNLPHVRPIARQVANACYGSPLVIDNVAIKFRERNTVSMWREGLRILQGWPGTDINHLVELLRT